MIRRPPISTRTDTLFPYTTLFRSGVSADNAADVKALAERYEDVDCSVGIHPLDVQPDATPALGWLLRELDHPRVVAIGETGLDYHYEPHAAAVPSTDERRDGKECVSPGRCRGSPLH